MGKVQLHDSKLIVTPMQVGQTLTKQDGVPMTDATSYHIIIGPLQYSTLTRPENSFSMNKLCQ